MTSALCQPQRTPAVAPFSLTLGNKFHRVTSLAGTCPRTRALQFCLQPRRAVGALTCADVRFGSAALSGAAGARRESRLRVTAASSRNPAPAPPEGEYLGKLGKAPEGLQKAPGASQLSAAAHTGTVADGNGISPAALFIPLFIAIALPILGGVLVSNYANPLSDWYQNLVKPTWEPPDWLFGAVWSLLYVLMGVASFLVWASAPLPFTAPALRLYFLQLLVNYSWTIVFFKLQQLAASVFVAGVLSFLVFSTMTSFAAFNPLAAWLLAPYFLWSLYAFGLNWSIWRLNNTLPGASWTSSPRQGGGW